MHLSFFNTAFLESVTAKFPFGFLACRHCFTKAEQLRQRHEEVLTNRAVQDAQNSDHGNKMNTESNSNEEDETDFDEFLNWRAKIS